MVAKKVCWPKWLNRPKRLSLSFTGPFISAKHSSMPCVLQRLVQFAQHVGGGDVDAGHRLGRHHQPAHRRRRRGQRVAHHALEPFGIGKEQRRVPAQQHQPGMRRASGWRCDVVVAVDAVDPAQHRRVRAPAVPQELDHRDDDRQHDALDRTQQQHARGAADGQPELPGLDAADALQVAPFDQAHAPRR